MAQFSSGFIADDDPEDELYRPKRPITPDEFDDEISSQDQSFARLPSLSFRPPRGAAGGRGFTPLTRETSAAVRRGAAESVRQQKTKTREADKLAKQQQVTKVKQQREAGVVMETDDTGQTVAKTTAAGAPVYNPGWTGAPKYDPAKKSWLRDFRDDTGKVSTKDLWDQGDIIRDKDTGDLYINMPGGARQVVGKDEDFLRMRDLAQEIKTSNRQTEENRIDLANQKLALVPLKKEYEEKEKKFKEASERAKNLNRIALARPGYLDNKINEKEVRDRNNEFEEAKKAFLPMRSKKEALDKRELEIQEAKNKADERELAMHRERDTLEAARRRPEFAAPTQPDPTEPPDVTAERQKNGIAGDGYRFPDQHEEQRAMQKTLADIDTQLTTESDPAKIAELIQAKKVSINTWTGRKAAHDRWKAQDVSLEAQARGIEGLMEKRQAGFTNNTMWARALFHGEHYKRWLKQQEADMDHAGQKRAALRGKQNELKKQAWQALQTPSDFPETLLRSLDGKSVDLDPLAVSLRVQGRFTAFHSDPRSEMLEVLDEIEKGGKVHTIGGKSIKEMRQMVKAQRDIYPEDLMTREDSRQIQKGLRGPLVSHNGELFREPKAEIKKPGEADPEEENRQFLMNLLFGSRPEKREPMGEIKPVNVLKETFKEMRARGKAATLGIPQGLAHVITQVMNTQAVAQATLSGPGKGKAVLRQLVGTVAPSLASPLMPGQVKPENHPFHKTATDVREWFQKTQGEHSDAFLTHVMSGIGSSAAFAPAAAMGGSLGVGIFGAVAGYGDGYFDALAKAQAKGRQIPEWQAHLNGLTGAGLNATEGLPLARAMERLDKTTGGTVKRLLNTVIQGAEEYGQEFGQNALQGMVDSVQKLDDRNWKQILGDSATASTPALFAGLLMGLGMNAADQTLSRRQATDATATFNSLNGVYTGLVQALQSPEALDAYNQNQKQPITLETATALLGKVETARNDAALSVIQKSDDTHTALKALMPTGDRQKFLASITKRPGVLSQTIALGRDLGPIVVPENSREAWHKPQGPQADLIRHVLAGREVLNQLESLAIGKTVSVTLGEQLEAQGLLIQKPTETGTVWVATMPAVSLFDGQLREAIAKDPHKFSVATAADTVKTGALSEELKKSGDALIEKDLTGIVKPPNSQANEGNLGEASAAGIAGQSGTGLAGGGAAVEGVPGGGKEQLSGVAPVAAGQAGQGTLEKPRVASEAGEPHKLAESGSTPGPATTFQVKLQSAPDKSGFTAVRTLSVLAETPEAAEQLAYEQAKTNRWKGDWQPIEVLVTKSASQEYSKESGQVTESERPGKVSGQPEPGGSGKVSGTEAAVTKGTTKGTVAPATTAERTGEGKKPSITPSVDKGLPRVDVGKGVAPQGRREVPSREVPITGAEKFAGREIDVKLAKKALAKLGIRINTRNPIPFYPGETAGTRPNDDGSIDVYLSPSVVPSREAYNNAAADEELFKHVPGMLALRLHWEADGKPGPFFPYVEKKVSEIYNDLIDRVESLDGKERSEVEKAMAASFNLYFADFFHAQPGTTKGKRAVDTLEDIKLAVEQRLRFIEGGDPASAYSFINEFARQIVQLRDSGSITETTLSTVLESILKWINGMIDALRTIAITLEGEGGVLDGTKFQTYVLEMEEQMRKMNDLMDDEMARQSHQAVDIYHADPIVSALIDMGGILSKTAAQKAWSKEKWDANKSAWDDAPKLSNPKHNSVYNPTSGVTPDAAASYLSEAGLLPEGANANDLWAQLGQISQRSATIHAPMTPLHSIMLDAYRSGQRNNIERFKELMDRFPSMRKEILQTFGRGRRAIATMHARQPQFSYPKDAPVQEFSNAKVVGPTLFARRAYHGTPHKVDKFSTEKVGMGEGAQVYGWGLYFAEEPAVAKNYAKTLGRPSYAVDGKRVPRHRSGHAALDTGQDLEMLLGYRKNGSSTSEAMEEVARQNIERRIAYWNEKGTKTGSSGEDMAAMVRFYEELARDATPNRIEESRGNTYTVDLDVEPEDLLDWDKPLSQQSEKVKKGFVAAGMSTELAALDSGAELYKQLSSYLIPSSDKSKEEAGWGDLQFADKGPELAAKQLAGLGIPGIRYLDQGSRDRNRSVYFDTGVKKWVVVEGNGYAKTGVSMHDTEAEAHSAMGTYNYVLFDDSKIKILEENGKPVSEAQKGTLFARRPRDTATGDLFAQPISAESTSRVNHRGGVDESATQQKSRAVEKPTSIRDMVDQLVLTPEELSGQTVMVKVTDPISGEVQQVNLSAQAAQSMALRNINAYLALIDCLNR